MCNLLLYSCVKQSNKLLIQACTRADTLCIFFYFYIYKYKSLKPFDMLLRCNIQKVLFFKYFTNELFYLLKIRSSNIRYSCYLHKTTGNIQNWILFIDLSHLFTAYEKIRKVVLARTTKAQQLCVIEEYTMCVCLHNLNGLNSPKHSSYFEMIFTKIISIEENFNHIFITFSVESK